jgi:HTH-type transcriptional regulator/antitoxin HigA
MALNKDEIEKVYSAGATLEPLLRPIKTEAQHDFALQWMEKLMIDVPDASNHPLSGLLDTLAERIHVYEEQHYPMATKPDPIGMLSFLMEQHGLKQKDLIDVFGSQGIISEVLNGKRQLNKRHIELLSQRFHVSPEVFF